MIHLVRIVAAIAFLGILVAWLILRFLWNPGKVMQQARSFAHYENQKPCWKLTMKEPDFWFDLLSNENGDE